MNFISIAYYTILRNLRDTKTLATMVLSQILIILILGTALGSEFQITNIDRTKVAYLNKDKQLSRSFDEFLNEKKTKEFVDSITVSSYEEGMNLVNEKKVSSFIIIDDNYTQKILSGEDALIKVINRQKGSFRSSIVQNVIDSFLYTANLEEAVSIINGENKGYKNYKNIQDVSITSSGKKPKAIDFYAVTMLVMMIMYGSMYGSFEVGEDIFDSIGRRMRSTPIKSYQLFLGKTIGSIFIVYMEALTLIFFAKFAYKVNWGSNILIILLIAFLMCALTTGFGIMVTMLCADHYTANRILNLITPIFTFFSGGFVSVTYGGVLGKITEFIPNKLAHNALFNSIYPIYTDSMHRVKWSIMMMLIMIVLTFLISILSERRMSKCQ
ncbi:ABC transporter permease [Clostridium sp. CS001]|uniref:ABC transporter permease n=1 Tax=Clostridium sp. CS001 TaxID=2880648 RepID=UPI001CF3637B|nr:ABC transporter permease [Clostridium sp. CS001]MCB2291157.1 ABC transporter permease [Clostridium sp. CS001]